MASVKTKFAVGLFVALGLAIATVTIVWLGMSHYFEKGRYFAVYFDESVQGLDRDSPVKYRGVSIGRVHTVAVAPDVRLIEVVLKIDPELDDTDDMVATLKSVGITGIMYVELDRKVPEEEAKVPALSFKPEYPVIATRPSEIQRLFTSVESLVAQFGKLNIGGISTKIEAALDEIRQSLESLALNTLSEHLASASSRLETLLDPQKWDRLLGSITRAGEDFGALSRNATGTVDRLDGVLDTTLPAFGGTLTGLDSSIKDLGELLARIHQVVGGAEDLISSGGAFIGRTDRRFEDLERSLSVSLGNLESASDKMDRLLDAIADQPSRVVFGTPFTARPEEEEKGR